MLTRSQRRRVDKTEEAAQQANNPTLANLSDDLLLDCCKLLPVTSLVSFSACSKNLREVANHGSLWTQLSIPPESAAGLTDRSLAGLLQRVDAKNYMTLISLTGCSQIDGSGLWPLHDSTALRAIDLRRFELDQGDLRARPLATSAQRFLVQMIPRLDSVLVTDSDVSLSLTQLGPGTSASASKFCLTLAEAGLAVADSPCILCHELMPASKAAAQARRWTGPRLHKCSSCRRSFCRECEDASFRECCDCGLWRCNSCLEFEDADDEEEIYLCDAGCYLYEGYGSDGG